MIREKIGLNYAEVPGARGVRLAGEGGERGRKGRMKGGGEEEEENKSSTGMMVVMTTTTATMMMVWRSRRAGKRGARWRKESEREKDAEE